MLVRLWGEIYEAMKDKYPDQPENVHRLVSVSKLIGKQVIDVVTNVEKNIKKHKIKSVDDIRKAPEKIAVFSPEMNSMNEELKDFLYKHLYRHHRVVRMSGKAERILKDLFRIYLEIPEQLPPDVYQEFIKSDKNKRVISDYIAQMTDKFAIDEHNKLFNPYERV
jgi:dGTPase